MATEPGKPVKARPAVLHRGMRVKDAFQAVMAAGVAHLQANERGVLGRRNPEHLHQMRVALRRLRSAVEIFGPLLPAPAVTRPERGIKWLAASLGPARDWDVFLTETLPAIKRKHDASRRGTAEFIARCKRLRSLAGARAQRVVRSIRYRRFIRSLAALIDSGRQPLQLGDTVVHAVLLGPVEEFASAVLERRHGQVRKKGRRLGKRSARELHRLRVAIKKYRYAADFFAGLYDAKSARKTLKQLARLQDILGAINDAATATDMIARGFDGAASRKAAEARGIVFGWSRGEAAILRGKLKVAWKEFRSAERFWR